MNCKLACILNLTFCYISHNGLKMALKSSSTAIYSNTMICGIHPRVTLTSKITGNENNS